ncbi:MAG: hypothetical protein ACI4O7_14770 [Aristaeellaceae bacterium]
MIETSLSFTCDLDRGIDRTPIRPALLTGDKQAHTLRVTVRRSGAEVALEGASVSAYFVRSDGVTVPVTGSVSGAVASVTLTESCYRTAGRFQLAVKLAMGAEISTILWADGMVSESTTDAIVDDENVIPSLEELLAQIAATEAAADSANSAADSANGAASSADAAASRAESAAEAANAAASSLDGMTAQALTLEPGSDATAGVETVDGVKVLTIGVPKGDKGDKGDQGEKGDPGRDGDGAVSTVNGIASVDGNVTLTAQDVGARPDTWVPTAGDVGALPDTYTPPVTSVNGQTGAVVLTAEDVGALPTGGTAADSGKLGGQAPGYYMSPESLIDNGYMPNPVWQRDWESGDSVAGWTYFLDRWENFGSSAITPYWSESGLTLSSGTIGQMMLLGDYVGQTVTAACKFSDGLLLCASGTVTNNADWTEIAFQADSGRNIDLVNGSSGQWYLTIMPGGGTIEWVAVYPGEFTADTLPPFRPKGYAAELAECMRYYQLTGYHLAKKYVSDSGAEGINVAWYVPMRITPTVTLTTAYAGNIATGPTANNVTEYGMRLDVVSSSLTTLTQWDGLIEASADL